MSYTRRFKKTIEVPYSGYVKYPKSEFGGSQYYDGRVTETIYFDVTVDTDPFDDSIVDMKDQVNILTGSIAATEAAQVASIRENSRKIGQTIVTGFFKTVQSDISQQVAALKIKTDALLVQLHELVKRLTDKKREMGVDYQRISSRYGKIFEELNKELENRIYSVDAPVFKFAETTSTIGGEVNKHVGIPVVHAAENVRLHSKITAAHAKNEAVKTIGKAQQFLNTQYRVDRLLSHCLQNDGSQAVISAPYCVMEVTDSRGHKTNEVYCAPMLKEIPKDRLAEPVLENDPHTEELLSDPRLKEYFNAELAEYLSKSSSEHAKRVAQLTNKLFK